MNSQQQAEEFLDLLKQKEEYDNKLKELNKQINGVQGKLYETMDTEQVDSIEIDGIKFAPKILQEFGLTEEFKGKKWDEIVIWFEWLRSQGEGALIKTKETVHAGTRKKFLRVWVEEKKPLPQFVTEKFVNTVDYNKSAVKRLALGENNG